jgi:hypothetical protein
MALYGKAYRWLVDSQAVRRYEGVDEEENYNRWVKLKASKIPDAWFERAPGSEDECYVFDREEVTEGSGDTWYQTCF